MSVTDGYTVTRQGSFLQVQGRRPRIHAGGGKRGVQHGHGPRAARRLYKFLLATRKPARVIWLTFPDIVGPERVRKYVKSLWKKMERRLEVQVSSVAKMEVQERLAAEVGMVVWGVDGKALDALPITELWAETIGAFGRIRVDPIRDWNALSSYLSKILSVNADAVTVGRDTTPLSKGHILGTSSVATSGIEPFLSIHEEWINYSRHFYWKHRPSNIPRHPRLTAVLSNEQVAALRRQVNDLRSTFFVGEDEGFSLRGNVAAEAITRLPPHLWEAEDISSSISIQTSKSPKTS